MNWTGGRLHQSKHTNRGLTAKQKNYFANARAKLHNGHPADPPRFPIFEDLGLNTRSPLLKTSRLANERRSDNSLQWLVEHETHTPAGRHHASTSLQSTTRRPSRDLPMRNLKIPHDLHASSSLGASESRNGPHSTNHRAVEDHGSRNHGQNRQSLDNGVNMPGGLSLEAKRQELLSRPNWLGTSIMKRLKMDFPSLAEDERVAKRRRLNEADLARRDAALQMPRLRVANSSQPFQRRQRFQSYGDIDQEISFRIGSSIHGSQEIHRRSRKRAHLQYAESDSINPRLSCSHIDERDATRSAAGSLRPEPGQHWTADNMIITSIPSQHSKSSNVMLFDLVDDNFSDSPQASMNGEAQRKNYLVSSSSPLAHQFFDRDDKSTASESSRQNNSSTIPQISECPKNRSEDSNNKRWKRFVSIPDSSLSRQDLENNSNEKAIDGPKDLSSVKNNFTPGAIVSGRYSTRQMQIATASAGPEVVVVNPSNVGQEIFKTKVLNSKHVQDEPAKQADEDENSAWFSFVFGNSRDAAIEESQAANRATEAPKPQERSTSSMDVQASDDSFLTPMKTSHANIAESMVVNPDTSLDSLRLSTGLSALGGC